MIRGATAADTAAIVELLVSSDLADAEEAARRVAACLARAADTCFVAVDEGAVVGAALASFNGFHLFLSHVAVAPSHRRRGVGSTLHAAVVERARALGAAGVIVDSWLSSAPFFHALGYRVPGAVFLIRDV
jgi:predicted N-acetyltransferase YhbS